MCITGLAIWLVGLDPQGGTLLLLLVLLPPSAGTLAFVVLQEDS